MSPQGKPPEFVLSMQGTKAILSMGPNFNGQYWAREFGI